MEVLEFVDVEWSAISRALEIGLNVNFWKILESLSKLRQFGFDLVYDKCRRRWKKVEGVTYL